MYFNKIAHPSNFVFADKADPAAGTLRLPGRTLRFQRTDLGGDVHRLVLDDGRWQAHGSQAELSARIEGDSLHSLELGADGALRLVTVPREGTPCLIEGVPGACIGVCGEAWLLQFRHQPDMQFYGLGEHSQGFEKSGLRAKFWNTDLWSDFASCQIRDTHANPMYVAIPWLIIKQGNRYAGILVNNPGAVFMDLASNFVWSEANQEDRERRSFYLGAPSGAPELYFLSGPDLPSLLRKLQTLVGRTPLPPLWALGHHQCRWGYGSPADLLELDKGFRKHRIPCDGLWLDIDYMDAYRVFSFSPKVWGDEPTVRQHLAELASLGRRVVPILDPGVKAEPGYEVCDDGLRKQIFCLNPEGRPFVGFVWPGRTHLPDFSLPEARSWWAERVSRMASLGVAGAWLDMNDPSVGAVELDDMLFSRGSRPHASYHNQYALGMAAASREGLLAARPDERPFLLSRSAFISSSRHTAVWTGDNVSNWHHLRQSIPVSLGLALSGLPFNGPDVGGFMGNTSPALACAWYKACFLFPFLRNHSCLGTLRQEPWSLGPAATRCIARYIRLRYKLLPYLYQLFIAQEERGDAILRPLFHDFEDRELMPLGRIADQFLVGPHLLQAPLLEEGVGARGLFLPGDCRWYSAHEAKWVDPGHSCTSAPGTATPLYVREGALVPMQPGEREEEKNDLSQIEVHCFLRLDSTESAVLRYTFDDGLSLGYRRGERSSFILEAWVLPDGGLSLRVRQLQTGYGHARIRLVAYDRFRYLRVVVGSRSEKRTFSSHPWSFTGRRIRALATSWFDLNPAAKSDAD